MLSVNKLFIHTLDDISEKLKNPTDYNLIRISGLLRQLLLDGGSSILIQVNRELKEPIRFKIAGNPNVSISDFFKSAILHWVNIYPSEGIPSHYVTLDKLLLTVIVRIKGNEFTVKNIIKVAANVLGGVHKSNDDSIDDSERLLIDMGNSFWINNYNSLVHQIINISKVVISGLDPIKRKIESSDGIEPQF